MTVLQGACISLEDTHLPKGSILKDQRTMLAAFAGPGPVVLTLDNKAETAGKITPGLAYIVQSAQDERELSASKDLLQYLPPWDPQSEFAAALSKELASVGHPGRFISPGEGGLLSEDLRRLDKSSDLLSWRLRYYIENPEQPVPRNYSTFLQLDDALVFEANLLYGVSLDDQENATPRLSAVSKLHRANTMRLLWRRENWVEDKAGQKLLYDFKREGARLIEAFQKLLPQLAQAVAADYKKELTAAGLHTPAAPAISTAPAPGALPAGWLTPATTAQTWISLSPEASTAPSAVAPSTPSLQAPPTPGSAP